MSDTEALPPRSETYEFLKDQVSTFYQFQKTRIQTGNRLVAHFYRKLGIEQATKMVEDAQEGKKTQLDFIDVLKKEYRRISDAVATKDFISRKVYTRLSEDRRGIFTTYAELSITEQYRSILKSENQTMKTILQDLETIPIYTEFLRDIVGIGPTMAGVIISTIDIRKSNTPASLWKFAGLDVVLVNNLGEPDGRGRGRYKEHLTTVTYIDRDGEEAIRESLTFNPFLKTKLAGVLAESFIKQRTPIYRDVYDDYKNRLIQRSEIASKKAGEQLEGLLKSVEDRVLAEVEEIKNLHPAGVERTSKIRAAKLAAKKEILEANKQFTDIRSKLHIERMARRYMIKRFLVALYTNWRELEGLEVVPEYAVAKLGLIHHQKSEGPRGASRAMDSDEDLIRRAPHLYNPDAQEDQTPEPF